MTEIAGGCLCGAIRYEINGEPFRIANCHCDDCRKATGSAYATILFFKEEQIKILQGTPKKFEHLVEFSFEQKFISIKIIKEKFQEIPDKEIKEFVDSMKQMKVFI